MKVFVVMAMFSILTVSKSVSWLCSFIIVLYDVTVVGNWVKVTQGLCVEFLTTACESIIISK